MKRSITLLLVGVLCLSLIACASDNKKGADDTKTGTMKEEKVYNIGDTIITKNIEFTLSDLNYVSHLDFYSYEPVEEDVMASTLVAGDGETYLSFSIHVKNTSKEDITTGDFDFCVDYDDGYLYEETGYSTYNSRYQGNVTNEYIKKLTEPVDYIVNIDVSNEVRDNEDKSLVIKVNLPNDEGEWETYSYVVR